MLGTLAKLGGSALNAYGFGAYGGMFDEKPPETFGDFAANIANNAKQGMWNTYQASKEVPTAYQDLKNELSSWGRQQGIKEAQRQAPEKLGINATMLTPYISGESLASGAVPTSEEEVAYQASLDNEQKAPERPRKAPPKVSRGRGKGKPSKGSKEASTSVAEDPKMDEFRAWVAKEYADYQKQQQELATQRQTIDERYKIQQNGRSVNPWDNPFLQSY